ncbi:MAG: SDR family oxidoreductase [Gammaproteobacteria bacterium]|nr:SDR family oxidoreductase [Gammaproteobacteria bacterium]
MNGTVLVTGAGRGLGLGFVRSFDADGWRVYATCRTPEAASELARLAAASNGRVSVLPLDVTNAAQIRAVAAIAGAEPLDILVNSAGTWGQEHSRFGTTDSEAWLQAFRVNTIAPLKLMEALVDGLAASRRRLVFNVSSRMGSIADNDAGGGYTYRSSKAALNAVVRSAAIDLAGRGIVVVAVHPGWVRTAMGGPSASLSVSDSVARMRALMDRIGPADSGCFFHCDGYALPW